MEKPKRYQDYHGYTSVKDYMETCIGKEVVIANSYEYEHGKIVKEKVLRVDRCKDDYQGDLYVMATWEDGYQSEMVTPLCSFFDSYFDQL